LPDGAGTAGQDLQLHGVPDGARAAREDLHLHLLPDGGRAVREEGSVYGLQAGAHNEDDPGHALRAQEGCLYGDTLLPESDLQAGSGEGMLPGPLLPTIVRLRRLGWMD